MSLVDFQPGQLWKSFIPHRHQITQTLSNELISLSVYPAGYFESFNPACVFEKWALQEVTAYESIPEGFEIFHLPEGEYAVFHYKGPGSDPSIFQYIYQNWLPASEFILDDRPHFEVLGPGYKNNAPDSEEEIWIPIKRKN